MTSAPLRPVTCLTRAVAGSAWGTTSLPAAIASADTKAVTFTMAFRTRGGCSQLLASELFPENGQDSGKSFASALRHGVLSQKSDTENLKLNLN